MGLQVAGIAAGNGRGSGNLYAGVAPESELIVVKMGSPMPDGFPRTTELMQAIGLCGEESTGSADAGGDQSEFWKYIWFS